METERKKFDKKLWRQRKYDHKFQVNQANEKRKKILKRTLQRELKREKVPIQFNPTPVRNTKEFQGKLKAAQTAFQQQKREKEELLEQRRKNKAELEQAMERHKKKRIAKVKILSKKTKKGQPVMKGRMELLYSQLQAQLT